jgi:hypothetical protein
MSFDRNVKTDSVFAALEAEVDHERHVQAMKYWYSYSTAGIIAGQQSLPFAITIEQGTDFKCIGISASAFAFNPAGGSSFPMPVATAGLAATSWACRGLTVAITDTRAGRTLTSGQVPFELFATPGYGVSFTRMFPFNYFFLRNSKVQFDIRNNENVTFGGSTVATGATSFSITLHGYKYMTSERAQ